MRQHVKYGDVTCPGETLVRLIPPCLFLRSPTRHRSEGNSFPAKARLQRSRHPQTVQQERGGGNEKNANLAVEILHLASLMRDQGDQGERPALTLEGNGYLLRERKIAGRGRRGTGGGGGGGGESAGDERKGLPHGAAWRRRKRV